MDAKEVRTHVNNLEKAVKDKMPGPHLVDLLKSLKTGVVATEKLLRVSSSPPPGLAETYSI
jgi:transcription elongation factor S-II